MIELNDRILLAHEKLFAEWKEKPMSEESLKELCSKEDLYEHVRLYDEISRENEVLADTHMSGLITIIFIEILAITQLHVILMNNLYENNIANEYPVFPRNWGKEGIQNPNLAFGFMLMHIANYALTILQTVRIGMELPARSLIRVIYELIIQTIVLVSDSDLCMEYIKVKDEDDNTLNDFWRENFSSGRMDGKIEKLEEEYGFDKSSSEEMKTWRKETKRRYSSTIHHSSQSMTYGGLAYTFDLNDADLIDGISIWGKSSNSLKAPLKTLKFALLYFITFFSFLLIKRVGWVPKKDDPTVTNFFFLKDLSTKYRE